MKRTLICLGSLLLTGALASSARADHAGCAAGNAEVPDCTSSGTVPGEYRLGHWFTHCFKRGTLPVLNGFHHDPHAAKIPQGGPKVDPNLIFPTHNYARSPRDFYMLDN